MHSIECPNPNCSLKTKEDLYLPIINKWNDKNKKEVEDEVFLKNFLIIVMNYFLYTDNCSTDMYLNLSLYYLKVIGNYCQAIYYYKKVMKLKLSLREEFSFIRLNIQISRELKAKLKPSNEECSDLENLDVSMYFKYKELSENLVDEIGIDSNLSLEFWKSFQLPFKEENKKIDFNKVFDLTEKIRVTKLKVENMWNKLIEIYGGVNDYFDLYLEYIEQINDDDLKKRDLESLRRKNDNYSEQINSNFYSILFNKETGIIIANGDKGNEGIIELTNKEIEVIFKYKPLDLIGMNLTCLMPTIFAKDHSKYIEKYCKIGQNKLINKSDFKTYGKDKDNSIIKIKLALKLFPILNNNIFFVSLISKEDIDDIIFLDDKFNIQGMSFKLMKILNINNKNLFQENEIPFYVICRKFVNFYKIFLQGKKNREISEKQVDINIEEGIKEKDEDNKKEDIIGDNDIEKEEIHENIEINENVELEYEIKLPQFLIDYSEKTNKKESKSIMQILSIKAESEEATEIIEEYDEEDLLMEEERKKDKELNDKRNNTINKNNLSLNQTPTPTPTPNPNQTPTPIGDTITPGENPISDSIDEESDIKNIEQNIVFNKESEEEKIFNTRMNQYKSLFNQGNINELEELIDSYNKNSTSIEYKFNFTFDKYKYGNREISYIVRCVDNKNDALESEEESAVDFDPKVAKYKKEKAESIKPLYELFEEERKEIIELPETFIKLSLENKKFQKLLQECKNDINIMSKAHGQKKDEVLEDENSSQTSQTGFDNGLVKKNKIEEIRNNLMMNISNFYTLKYIKIIIYLIGISTLIFTIIYILDFLSLYLDLVKSTEFNISLYKSTLKTSELISIFVTIRIIYLKEIIDNNNYKFDYLDFKTEGKNLSEYYEYCISKSFKLQEEIFQLFGFLEMNAPYYLSDEELDYIYWDTIKISYYNENYTKFYNNSKEEESFPMAIGQLLSNCLTFLEHPAFNSIVDNTTFLDDLSNNKNYFYYITFLIIENGYDNILPNLFKKINNFPDILRRYNFYQIIKIFILVIVYFIFIFILSIIYIYLFYITNKSMLDGMDKVSKIKLEKIEEIIKRINIFINNLKKFREKEKKAEDNKDKFEILDDESKIQSGTNIDLNNNKDKKKFSQDSSLINSGGFNLDNKRYIPLKILKYSFSYSFIIIIYSIVCLIIILFFSFRMVNKTNQLLIVQNYIYGKLISASTSTIEIKCYLSNQKKINHIELFNYSIIQNVIRGFNLFPKLKYFYNEQFLLNACGAAINNETDYDAYRNCLNDKIIITVNNTENLLKYIDNLIANLIKEFEINKKESENDNYEIRNLFNSTYYREIEKIFFKYLMGVNENFYNCLIQDISFFLAQSELSTVIIIVAFTLMIIIFCIFTRIIVIKKLIYYLTISRCVIRIIPTSVILSTPELEGWIENKY